MNAIPVEAGELEVLRKDAAIGALIRRKLTSGNEIPVERCTVLAVEIEAIDAAMAQSGSAS